jgi:hypothetical protein
MDWLVDKSTAEDRDQQTAAIRKLRFDCAARPWMSTLLGFVELVSVNHITKISVPTHETLKGQQQTRSVPRSMVRVDQIPLGVLPTGTHRQG